MEQGKCYWGSSDDQPPSTFSVVTTKKMEQGCLPTINDWVDYVFYGESDRASTLFGWAVSRYLMECGEDIMMVFNAGDEIIPPKGVLFK